MYLRPIYRDKDGKRHAYWALMESYRTARGPRTLHLLRRGRRGMSIISNWLGVFTGYRSTGATQTGIATPFEPESHLSVITAQDIWPDVDLATLAVSRTQAMQLAAAARGRRHGPGAAGVHARQARPVLRPRGSPHPGRAGWRARP